MLRALFMAAALASILAAAPPLHGADEPTGVGLSWALAAYRGSDADGRWIPVRGDTELEPGDRLSMMIELLSPGYVYVLHETADGLKLLFPKALPHKPAETAPGRVHLIPGGGRWLQLEDPGGEDAIHIVAAAEPLVALAAAIEAHVDSATDGAGRKAVLDRIATIQAERFDPQRVLRKPAAIGGTLRDPHRAAEVRRFATDISAPELFSESVTLFH